MKKIKIILFSLIANVLLVSSIAAEDQHEKQKDPFIELMLGQVEFLEGRITSLAEAIPEDKYSWAPSKEVRTTAGQLAHTIGAAYGIPSMMGAKMPEHITMDIDKTMKEKGEILENLKASFAAVKKFLNNYDTTNYEQIVKTPFGEFSQRAMILIINNHYHEHLGQLIVYARSNGIVPPWSKKEGDQ